jgi:CheY-like chemotaxis protein
MKLLIVEDNPEVAKVTRLLLEALAGQDSLRVDVAGTLAEAIPIVELVDVVLCDAEFPLIPGANPKESWGPVARTCEGLVRGFVLYSANPITVESARILGYEALDKPAKAAEIWDAIQSEYRIVTAKVAA